MLDTRRIVYAAYSDWTPERGDFIGIVEGVVLRESETHYLFEEPPVPVAYVQWTGRNNFYVTRDQAIDAFLEGQDKFVQTKEESVEFYRRTRDALRKSAEELRAKS